MEDCLFCKIIRREIKAYVVRENDHAMALLDVMPRAVGHTLVIPKVHAPTLLTLPDAEVTPVFIMVKEVGEILLKRLQPEGITIGMNQGRASGQEVDHLHIHLMPRWHADSGHAIQSVVYAPPKESLEVILQKIRG